MGYCLDFGETTSNRIHHSPVVTNSDVNRGDKMNKITADNYFSITPEWVLYADITSNAVRLYGVLQRYADKDSGECHPSRKTLAEKCRLSLSSLDRALIELVDIGAVTKQQRLSPNGDWTSNTYTVISHRRVSSQVNTPIVTDGETGIFTGDEQTRVNVNQSHEQTNAKSIADEWWEAYKQRTGGKPPTGKGAWHSLIAVITSALSSGWSEQEVRTAIMACTVASSAQLDRELTKTTPAQPVVRTMTRRLPVIMGDPECTECEGKGVVMVFDSDADKWVSKKCGCYQETFTP
jgi:hypothetical protein